MFIEEKTINMHKISFYQTHLTEGQWSYINKVFFENDCRHRKNSLRSIFEAILFILVSGCQWRMLPKDFPKWKTVYWHFSKWKKDGRIELCIEKMIMKIRRKRKQSDVPTVGALDAQSVKWGNHKSNNGFDANKRIKGIKRSIVVDRNGFILGRSVDSAGIHDSRLAHKLVGRTKDVWITIKKILADRGYRGEIIDAVKNDFDIDLEVSNTPNGIKGFTPKPLRWVVERTFAWLDRFRRLTRNYEQSDESAEEMIDFATIKLLLNHI